MGREAIAAPLTADDRLAIAELCARYCRAVDTRDIEGYMACFASDAVIEMTRGRFEGSAAIRGYATDVAAKAAPPRQHRIDQLILDGDRERCAGRSYLMVTERSADGSVSVSTIGEYVDTFVKRDGRWQIAAHAFHRWGAAAP